MKFLKLRKSPVQVIFLIVFSLFMAGCKQTAPSSEVNMDANWTADDAVIVNELLPSLNYGKANKLDLSNDKHYSFYIRQFIVAGITPETNPHLFEVIREMRKSALTKQMSVLPPASSQSSDDEGLDTVNQVTEIGTNDGLLWSSAGMSSVPGGTQVTHLVLSLYDQAGNQIGTQSAQQYNNGDTLSINSDGSVTDDQPIRATLTYFYQANDGSVGQGVHSLTAESYPVSVTNSFPVDSNQNSPGVILICLHRNSPGNCDFWIEETSPWPVKFPIKGSITYSGAIEMPFTSSNSFAYINLIDENGGGACTYNQIENFFDSVIVSSDSTTMTWSINLANFGNACSGNMNPVIYTMYFEVTVDGETVGYTISSASNVQPGRNAIKLPTMEIAYGCLAGGTLISMGDGSTKKIEDVEVGEKVATKDGGVLEVVNSVVGKEEQIYRVSTENGKNVLMSKEHPVPSGGEIKLAFNLKVGDEIVTDEGPSRIREIALEDFPSRYVFNLYVENSDGNIQLDDRLFYGNGVLVGDNLMQRTYAQQYWRDPANIRRGLDEEWHEDYDNYLKRISGN